MSTERLDELISKEEIVVRVKSLAKQIQNDFMGKDITIVSILKGGFIFAADLVREIDMPLQIAFMAVSSYGSSTESSGDLKIRYDIDISVEKRNVIIVEDIVDTGLTMSALKDYLLSKGAECVKICTIFDKPDRRKVHIDIDYSGFTIPNEFVVGYGLDYDNKYRNLKGLYKVTL